ncbi:hypothetical protein FVE85_9356 [Porphyridium purpureum]|uniref:Uncharacterized protein n=1 Tax=Porphyridium purpureum TaxID=35688 RepID=A0A5J4YQW2_PORPP|nr:hypothetical protein FVE85_9356 [Porphyridium purpureum]|eukprot:POR6846..scf222_8
MGKSCGACGACKGSAPWWSPEALGALSPAAQRAARERLRALENDLLPARDAWLARVQQLIADKKEQGGRVSGAQDVQQTPPDEHQPGMNGGASLLPPAGEGERAQQVQQRSAAPFLDDMAAASGTTTSSLQATTPESSNLFDGVSSAGVPAESEPFAVAADLQGAEPDATPLIALLDLRDRGGVDDERNFERDLNLRALEMVENEASLIDDFLADPTMTHTHSEGVGDDLLGAFFEAQQPQEKEKQGFQPAEMIDREPNEDADEQEFHDVQEKPPVSSSPAVLQKPDDDVVLADDDYDDGDEWNFQDAWGGSGAAGIAAIQTQQPGIAASLPDSNESGYNAQEPGDDFGGNSSGSGSGLGSMNNEDVSAVRSQLDTGSVSTMQDEGNQSDAGFDSKVQSKAKTQPDPHPQPLAEAGALDADPKSKLLEQTHTSSPAQHPQDHTGANDVQVELATHESPSFVIAPVNLDPDVSIEDDSSLEDGLRNVSDSSRTHHNRRSSGAIPMPRNLFQRKASDTAPDDKHKLPMVTSEHHKHVPPPLVGIADEQASKSGDSGNGSSSSGSSSEQENVLANEMDEISLTPNDPMDHEAKSRMPSLATSAALPPSQKPRLDMDRENQIENARRERQRRKTEHPSGHVSAGSDASRLSTSSVPLAAKVESSNGVRDHAPALGASSGNCDDCAHLRAKISDTERALLVLSNALSARDATVREIRVNKTGSRNEQIATLREEVSALRVTCDYLFQRLQHQEQR